MNTEQPFRFGFLATLGALLAIAIGAIILQLGTVLTYIGAALFLSLGFEPIIGFLERRGWKRGVAILVSIVTVVGILTLLVLAMIPSVTQQVQIIQRRYGTVLNELAQSNLVDWADRTFPGLDAQQAVQNAVTWLQNNAGVITGGFLQVSANIFNGISGALIVGILTLYFVASMKSMKRGFLHLMPASKRIRIAELTDEITGSVGKYVVGQIGLASINGILTFFVTSLLGGALPAVYAILAFFGSLVPIVGTITAAAIIVLAQLVLGDPGSSTWWILAIYYLVYMQVEAYVLSPRIMSHAVSVPGPLVIVGALIGGTLLGLLGALTAIPLVASALIIVKKVWMPAQNLR